MSVPSELTLGRRRVPMRRLRARSVEVALPQLFGGPLAGNDPRVLEAKALDLPREAA